MIKIVEVEVVDKPNKNGRIYTKEVMQKAIDEYRPAMVACEAVGKFWVGNETLDVRPIWPFLTLDMFIKADKVYAKIESLNSPTGLLLESNFEQFYFAISGIGDLDDEKVKNFQLTGILAVYKNNLTK